MIWGDADDWQQPALSDLVKLHRLKFLLIKNPSFSFYLFLIFRWFIWLATRKLFFLPLYTFVTPFPNGKHEFQCKTATSVTLISSSHLSLGHLGLELCNQELLLLCPKVGTLHRYKKNTTRTNTHRDEGSCRHRVGKWIKGSRSHCQLICCYCSVICRLLTTLTVRPHDQD